MLLHFNKSLNYIWDFLHLLNPSLMIFPAACSFQTPTCTIGPRDPDRWDLLAPCGMSRLWRDGSRGVGFVFSLSIHSSIHHWRHWVFLMIIYIILGGTIAGDGGICLLVLAELSSNFDVISVCENLDSFPVLHFMNSICGPGYYYIQYIPMEK